MRIRVEPKEFFMYTVFLAFNQDRPDSEDEAIRAYLEQHHLVPKTEGTQKLDNEDFQVMYFGGCYLGRHLGVIGQVQRKAVEKEMLTAEIERTLTEAPDSTTRRVADDASGLLPLQEIVSSLVQEFHVESSFGTDKEGYIKLTLEPDLIKRKFREMAGHRA